jgi:hypothetical protein
MSGVAANTGVDRITMQVANTGPQIHGVDTNLVTEGTLENVPFDAVCALNEQRAAAEQWLHEPRKWSSSLSHDRVQVVVHDDEGDQIAVAFQNCVREVVGYARFEVIAEPVDVSLGAREEVEGRTG